jgi:hypothetical protein
MDSSSIIDYIKKTYPKIVFQPFKFQQTRALAFILSNDNLVIGFINKNGVLCKLIEPIDIKELSSNDFREIVEKIPVVKGFTDQDKQKLIKLFEKREDTISKKEHEKIVDELKSYINKKEKELSETDKYKALFDSKSNEIILIENKYEEKIKDINDQYNQVVSKLQECSKQIIDQNEAILEGINQHKQSVKEFIASKDLKIEELEKIHEQDIQEKRNLQENLDNILGNEKRSLELIESNKDLISDYDIKLKEKVNIINDLESSIEKIRAELDDSKKELDKSDLQNKLLQGYKSRCSEKIIKEKSDIIDAIQKYNDMWLSWVEKSRFDIQEQKRKLIEDFKKAKDNLQNTLESQIQESNMSSKEVQLLKQNIKDIEMSLNKTINEQLIELSKKEDALKEKEQEISSFLSEKSQLESTLKSFEEKEKSFQEKEKSFEEKEKSFQEKEKSFEEKEKSFQEKEKFFEEKEKSFEEQEKSFQETESKLNNKIYNYESNIIPKLKSDLGELNILLEKNRNTPIESKIDYDNCYSMVSNFVSLNNIFYRKQEIIRKLDDIISNNLSYFRNLNESTKTLVKSDFEKVKTEINNHIKFLNLQDYIDSPNFEYLKSKATRSRVPDTYCNDLKNLLEYWEVNKLLYRNQDAQLTNIYENLSGAIRTYIRIKPLINKERAKSSIEIRTIEKKKIKGLTINCSSVPNTKYKESLYFGEFYGIFEEDFTNLDVYTGQRGTIIQDPKSLIVNINDIIESSDTISPGLYTAFRQVEQGYSIVLFGYGVSGSGKTFSLIGSKGNPGILHYGLANLENVTNIRLKYAFEQYYDKINFNNRKVSGLIHNLINKISQFKDVSVDETNVFEKRIPNYIDVKSLKIEDIYSLTDIIEKYRIEKNRIKSTPNNPVSSRSALYLVFEITFNDGTRGFITIVDMAGRESPIDIFNTFIDTNKTSLASVMAPPPVGGVVNIQKNIKEEYKSIYTPETILNILNEGFYINENINHLVYYFNMKNGVKIPTPKQKLDERYNVIYNVKNYFVQPQDEEKMIDNINNSLQIPILKFLDNLPSKKSDTPDSVWKPTKFITLCCIRQEADYCDQTMETVEFANNIKST